MVSQIGKLLKSAGKIAKQVRSCEPFVAKAGQSLTKGQKVANSLFKVAENSVLPLTLLGGVGTLTSLGFGIYGDVTGNDKLENMGSFGLSKGVDALLCGAGGLMIAGPLGFLAGAYLGFETNHSLVGAVIAAVESDFAYAEAKNDMAAWRQEATNTLKETLGFNSSKFSPEQQKALDKFFTELENLIKNGEPWTALKAPDVEGLSATVKVGEQELTFEANGIIIKTEDGITIAKDTEDIGIENMIAIHKFRTDFAKFCENGKDGDRLTVPNIDGLEIQVGDGDSLKINQNDILIHTGDGFYVLKPDSEDYKEIKALEKVQADLNDLVKNGNIGDSIMVPDIKDLHWGFSVNGQNVELMANDKITKTEDGIVITRANNNSEDSEAPTISFRRLGNGAQPLKLAVGQSHIAEEDMKLLVGKKNNLVSVNQGDTLICKPDSTLDVRPFVQPVQKVSIRKIGSPAPVEYEVGKTYTADNDTRFLVGPKNSLITIKTGQSFQVNADGTVQIVD